MTGLERSRSGVAGRVLVVCASLLLAQVAVPAEARAAEPSAAELEAARQMFADGQKLEKNKEYEAALGKFRKVVAIKSTAIVRYHQGFCAEKANLWLEALDAYTKAVVEGEGDPKQKTAVEASRKAAEALRPRVPRIHVKVKGAAKGKYELHLDGVKVADALVDQPIPVDLGKHAIELSGEGLVGDKREVFVAEKETREVAFEAEEVGPPTDPKKDEPKKDEPKKDEPKKDEPKKDEPRKVEPPPPPPPARRPLAISVGVSLGNVQPLGRVLDGAATNGAFFARPKDPAVPDDKTTEQADYFGAGLALELDLGVRLWGTFLPHLFYQRSFIGQSNYSKTDQASLASDAFGLGLGWTSHPEGKLGAYVDLSIAYRTTHYVGCDRSPSEDCANPGKATLSGLDLVRLKLGVAFRPAKSLTLLGFAWGQLGTYTKLDGTDGTGAPLSESTTIDQTATHYFVGLAAGAAYDLAL